jgi:hypothetical protein
MRQFLAGMLAALLLMGAVAAWVWHQRPDLLPEGVQQQNPNSPRYAPAVYRWKDAQGRTQISDSPPPDRPYETVRIDPETNAVPDTLPRESDIAPRQ